MAKICFNESRSTRLFMKRSSSPVVTGSILLVVLLFFSSAVFFVSISRQRKAEAIQSYKKNISLEARSLADRFEQLSILTGLLSTNPAVMRAMPPTRPSSESTEPQRGDQGAIHDLLSSLADIRHISAAYLLDTGGTCIFSSQPGFLGKNYSFRPYFSQALQGASPVYLAKGITSKKLGVYFSRPVKDPTGKTVVGVAVLKIDPVFFDVTPGLFISPLSLDQDELRIGLVTDTGIFADIINNSLLSIDPLNAKQKKELASSRQFPPNAIRTLNFPAGTWELLKEKKLLRQTVNGQGYLLFAVPLAGQNLSVVHIVKDSWFNRNILPISGFYKGLLVIFAVLLIIACWLIFLSDRRHRIITQQADALARSEQRLRLFSKAVEQSGNTIVITDRNGDIIYVNPHFTVATGYSQEEALGNNPRILKSGSQPQSVYEELWQTLTQGKTWKGVLQNRKKNGELYWEEATISPITDSTGKTTHYIAIKEDISDRITLTEKLRAEKEKLELIVEHAGLGIAIISNRCLTWVNDAGVVLFGYDSADQVIGRPVSTIYPDQETYQRMGEEVYRTLAEKTIFKTEIQLRRRDGSLFWCSITGKTLDLRNPDQGTIWIAEDISNRKRDEEQLRQAIREAEEANAMKSRLLANISHDIRTPLHGIIGTFTMLQTMPIGREPQELVRSGNRAAEYLLSLLNNLLDLSKIEAGQLVLDSFPFSFKKILTEVGDILASQFSEKSIAYRYTVDESIPDTLFGDPLRIQQILTNLVGNSIKFTEQGSITVTVSGEQRDDHSMEIVCHVRDTGIGIPADRQERLFEAFTQADNSITRKYGGTGLGLSICRELCLLMGGRIWFESEEGHGTTFHVSMICDTFGNALTETGTGDRTALLEVSTEEKVPPLSLLIVDDNEANQKILSMMLEHDGHQAQIESNGLQALRRLARSRFDLIFMDMQMPVMDGLTAARIIRGCEAGTGPEITPLVPHDLAADLLRNLENTRTPIIALTANALLSDQQRCLEAGMDRYLVKPFTPEQLYHVLADLMGRRVSEETTDNGSRSSIGYVPRIEDIRQLLSQRYPFSDEQISTLVETTIRTMDEDIRLLMDLFESEETEKTAETAHKIKGSALNMGLEFLAETLSGLESAANENDTAACRQMIQDLQVWWHRFRRQLK